MDKHDHFDNYLPPVDFKSNWKVLLSNNHQQ